MISDWFNTDNFGVLAADTTLSIWNEITLYTEHSDSRTRVQWRHFSELDIFTTDSLQIYMKEYFNYQLTTKDINLANSFFPVRGVVFMEDFFAKFCKSVIQSSKQDISITLQAALKEGINSAQSRFRVIIQRMMKNTSNPELSQPRTVVQLIDKIFSALMFEDGNYMYVSIFNKIISQI